jgi:hypothetical protein
MKAVLRFSEHRFSHFTTILPNRSDAVHLATTKGADIPSATPMTVSRSVFATTSRWAEFLMIF